MTPADNAGRVMATVCPRRSTAQETGLILSGCCNVFCTSSAPGATTSIRAAATGKPAATVTRAVIALLCGLTTLK